VTIFTELTIIVAVATIIAFLMRLLRQPLIIGYILSGILVGPLVLDLIKSGEALLVFSEMGIALLLFIVGLNLTPRTIKRFGKVSIITGVGQVLFTATIGLGIARLLGFSYLSALYLGIALSFSSTIIILKLLSDRNDLEKLYGKISIGFLLVQDFIAVLLLFLAPLVASEDFSPHIVFLKVVFGLLILGILFLITKYIFPILHRVAGKSQELLFLFSLAWGLGLATLFKISGFSLESGALIAGISLSAMPSHEEIHARLKPLRDFFIVLFFVLLGAEMAVAGTVSLFIPAVLLSLFVLIGNPIILMIIMGLLGYRKKTSFQTGLTVAQISEFSLIVVALGVKLNHVSPEILSLATLVGIITIFGSTYMIMNSDRLYNALAPFLTIFERKKPAEENPEQKKNELILFGHNRIGFDFIRTYKKFKIPFVVIDYNPDIIESLNEQKIDSLYGDASDLEFLKSIDMSRIKMAVSTIPDYFTNLLILREARAQNKNVTVICVLHSIDEALDIYKRGANYVIMPHFLGGQTASKLVEDNQFNKKSLRLVKFRHIKYLKKRLEQGHEHPNIRLNQ